MTMQVLDSEIEAFRRAKMEKSRRQERSRSLPYRPPFCSQVKKTGSSFHEFQGLQGNVLDPWKTSRCTQPDKNFEKYTKNWRMHHQGELFASPSPGSAAVGASVGRQFLEYLVKLEEQREKQFLKETAINKGFTKDDLKNFFEVRGPFHNGVPKKGGEFAMKFPYGRFLEGLKKKGF